jgi:hypothetical protein
LKERVPTVPMGDVCGGKTSVGETAEDDDERSG